MADYRVIDVEQLENDLTVVADAIREKSGTSEPLAFPNGMKEAVEAIQSGGETDLLEYSVYISESFLGVDFGSLTDIHIKLGTKVNADYKSNSLRQVFANTKGVKNIKITTKESSVTVDLQNLFYNSADLEVVDLTDFKLKASSIAQLFHSCKNLREIKGVLDLTSNTSSSMPFFNCQSLERVTVKERTIRESINFGLSSLLSNQTIQSIIDGLMDLTGQTAQTLTFHTNVKTKITEAQKTQITSKNWILA